MIYERDKPKKESVRWSADTHIKGKKPGKLLLQEDGNLVIYDDESKLVAALDDYGSGEKYAKCQLVLTDGGKLILMEPGDNIIWDTRKDKELRQRQ